MVHVTGLKKYFKTRKSGIFDSPGIIKAVDDISFSIPRGTTMGMVGESGSGKTTASRAVFRLVEPDAGEITIGGTEVHTLKKNDLRRFRKNMQMVFQDPYGSLNPRMTVGGIISEPLRIHSVVPRKNLREHACELLNLVGLGREHHDRYPHEFSGGQRQRIGIARAIALNPGFIILDEPVSALDVSIQGQLLNLLSDLQDKLNLTYLIVAHDLAVIEHMSARIVVMYLGKIVEEAPSGTLATGPLHPYTKSLIRSIPGLKAVKHGFTALRGEIPSPESPPSGCHFHPRCPQAMDVCREIYPPEKKVGHSRVCCHLY